MKFEPVDILVKDGSVITLREAIIADAEQLRDVTKEYVEESEYIPTVKDEFNPSIEEEEKYIASFIDTINRLLIVALKGDKIIGSISVNGESKQMMKHTAPIGIGMLKEWRGKGIGSAMFRSVIRWAKEQSPLEVLWLETLSTNEAGKALYGKFGFEETGIIPNHIKFEEGKYTDTVIMSLTL